MKTKTNKTIQARIKKSKYAQEKKKIIKKRKY
jgi:hypothetical protein